MSASNSSDERPAAAVLCGLLLAGVLALSLTGNTSALDGRSSILRRQVDSAADNAAGSLAMLKNCPGAGAWPAGDRQGAIAAAVVAGENALRNPVERIVEDALVALGPMLNFRPPDVSLGAAQISPAHYAAFTGGAEGYWATVADPCASLAFAKDWIAGQTFPLDTEEARRLAFSAWSGHAGYDPQSADFFALAAYYLYCERLYRRAGGT